MEISKLLKRHSSTKCRAPAYSLALRLFTSAANKSPSLNEVLVIWYSNAFMDYHLKGGARFQQGTFSNFVETCAIYYNNAILWKCII